MNSKKLRRQKKRIKISKAILIVTSPIVINVPTRGLLAVETKVSFVLWLAKLENQLDLFVNSEYRYIYLFYFLAVNRFQRTLNS